MAKTPGSQLDRINVGLSKPHSINLPFGIGLTPEVQRQLDRMQQRMDAFYASLPPIDWEMMERVAELHRFETTMAQLGMVAHPFLLERFGQELAPDAQAFVTQVWPNVRHGLMSGASRFGDERSIVLFRSMIAAHDAGLFELVPIAAATLMERVVRLVRRKDGPRNPEQWLRDVGHNLAPADIGGYPGIRVWQVLVKHTFAQCWGDATADSIPFMNRHALAHGMGSRLATSPDSFNAVLLAHFVLWIATVVSGGYDLEAAS